MQSILGKALQTGALVRVGDTERCGGLYIVGKPRSGKSNVLISLALQDAQHGHGLLFIDPHADAIVEFLSRLSAERAQDVILLDPLDTDFPFGLNVLQCPDPTNLVTLTKTYTAAMDIFVKVFGDEEGRLGTWLEKYLHNSIYALLENPGYTLAEIPLMLASKQFRQYIASNMRVNQEVAEFWAKQFDKLTKHDQVEQVESTLTRLNAVLGHPLVKHIVGQANPTLDFSEIMNRAETNKIVLLKMSRLLPKRVQTLLGTLLVSQVLQAAQERESIPADERRFFAVYADEFQNFSTPDFAKLFTETGKRRLMPTVAHQERVGQLRLTDPNRGATLAAANKLLFSLSVRDAEELAPEVANDPGPQRVEEIVKEEIIGTRPVKTYKRDVVGHLVRQGHEDPRVMHWVTSYLQPLEYARQGKLITGYGGRALYDYKYPSDPVPDVAGILLSLNDWLYQGMTERTRLFQRLPAETLKYLCSFFMLAQAYTALYRPGLVSTAGHWLGCRTAGTLSETITGSLQALIDVLLQTFPQERSRYTSAWDRGTQVNGLSLGGRIDFFALWQRQGRGLNQVDQRVLSHLCAHPQLSLSEYERVYTAALSTVGVEVFLPSALSTGLFYGRFERVKDKSTGKQYVYDSVLRQLQEYIPDFYRYQQFRASLFLTQLGLHLSPLLTTDSGKFEPDTRTQTHYITHPQRTFTDMVNEMAQELTNLPRFTAYAKLAEEQQNGSQVVRKQKLTTLPLPPAHDAALVRALEQEIRQRTQTHYCCPRTAVEEDIRERQAKWRHPDNHEPPPSQTGHDPDNEPPPPLHG